MMGTEGIGKDEEVLVSYSWLILLFLYFPMMVLMVYSFNDSRINAGKDSHSIGIQIYFKNKMLLMRL